MAIVAFSLGHTAPFSFSPPPLSQARLSLHFPSIAPLSRGWDEKVPPGVSQIGTEFSLTNV